MDSSLSNGRDSELEMVQPRDNINHRTPISPVQAYAPMAQSLDESIAVMTASNARDLRGNGSGKFCSNYDLFTEHAPPGFPRIAAMKVFYPDMNQHPRFRYLGSRLCEQYAMRLNCVMQELDKQDVKAQKGHGRPGLTLLPFDPKSFIARCLASADQASVRGPTGGSEQELQMENLIENGARLWIKYNEMLHIDHEAQKFARVPRTAHKRYVQFLKERHGLAGDALNHLLHLDDNITTEVDTSFMRFSSILFGKEAWYTTPIKFLFGGRRVPRANDEEAQTLREFNSAYLRGVLRAVTVCLSSSLLLIPVALLYLVPLSKEQKFGVVVAFSIIFSTAITHFEPRWSHAAVGLSAFWAVLVTNLG